MPNLKKAEIDWYYEKIDAFKSTTKRAVEVIHTVPLPTFIKAEPVFEIDVNGKLVAESFNVKLVSLDNNYYEYVFAAFSFEGHVVLVYGSSGFVIDIIHDTYEYDVFEVGFDELLLFHSSSDVRKHVNNNYNQYSSNSEGEGRTIHQGF